MTVILTAQQSKKNRMNTHLKRRSRLNNESFDLILIGDFLIAGLTRYSKVWNKFLRPLNAVNCWIEDDRVQHVLGESMIHALFYVCEMLISYAVSIIYTRNNERILRTVL